MKNKKLIKLGTSLALVAAIGAGATLAYLSKPSNTVTNGFTVGKGYVEDPDLKQAVWIDETKVGKSADGEKMYNNRTLVGNTYTDVMADSSFTKDPILRLNTGSVESYVFIEVSGADELEAKGITTDIGYENSGWKKVQIVDNKVVDDNREATNGIYMYETTLNPTNGVASTKELFKTVTVASNFEQSEGELETKIVLKGCAVQAVYSDDSGQHKIPAADVQVPVFK